MGTSLIVGWSQFYRKKRLDVRQRSAHARSPDIKGRRVKAFAGFDRDSTNCSGERTQNDEKESSAEARGAGLPGGPRPGIAVSEGHPDRLRRFLESGLHKDLSDGQEDPEKNGQPTAIRIS